MSNRQNLIADYITRQNNQRSNNLNTIIPSEVI